MKVVLVAQILEPCADAIRISLNVAWLELRRVERSQAREPTRGYHRWLVYEPRCRTS